ncbi:MAG: transglycosylase domain-containing protein [Bacteroidales bacterium]|nr:transglycosylase domain-containing protein [Bacteroidales bacterium]
MAKEKKNYRKSITTLWIIFILLLTSIIIFFTGISAGWFGFMPSFEELENPKSNLASEIYSSDNKILGKFYIENRSNIHYSDLSPNLVNSLIAIEDVRFRQHSGIDAKAILRVAYGLISGKHKGGGSTITQQLAKNLFPRGENLSKPKFILRKFKEWITAVKLERNYTKDEIIAMYFNTVDFGSQSFGIKSAAKTFFNSTPMELKIEEAALLVGIVNAPTRYSPVRNPNNALKRRNLVLNRMMKCNFIKKEVYDSVINIPIDMSRYKIQDHNTGLATYFREYLKKQLKQWCKTHYKADGSEYNLFKDGLKIYTTINYKMQEYAEEAIKEHLGGELQDVFFKHWEGYDKAPFEQEFTQGKIDTILMQAMHRTSRYKHLVKNNVSEDSINKVFNTPVKMQVFSWHGDIDTVMSPMDSIKYYKYFIQSGLMSIEPGTGFVRAYVGGIDYKYFKYDHVTQGKRQVGSTFKPFLYSLAMQEGESPCTKVPNIQPVIDLPSGETWAPRNDSKKRLGEMVSLKWALANSNNWISAYLIKRYTPLNVIKMARKMGITSYIAPVPSICLGTPDISLYEMTAAMNTFASKGIYIKPLFIKQIADKRGNIIEKFTTKQNEAMSEETAYLMLSLLKGVVQSGTGIRLRYKYHLNNPIAGKTGTTQNNSDGWFMGITPDLVTGVWTGCEDRSVHFRTIRLGQGANMALPIWAIYMKKIYADSTLNISKGDFEKPLTPLSVEIDCDKYDEENNTNSDTDMEVF